MKLWRISQSKRNDWDTYDSAVVAAETEFEAKRIHPRGGELDAEGTFGSSWVCDPKDVECEYLGESKDGLESGVICASFNAG